MVRLFSRQNERPGDPSHEYCKHHLEPHGAWVNVLGFSLFLALASISAWGLITFTSMSWIGTEWITRYETLRSVGFLGTLLVFGIGCLRLAPVFNINTTKPSALFWVAGYAGISALAITGQAYDLLVNVASLCLGIAHALAFIVWQRVFASQESPVASRQIVIGSTLGSVIYLLVSLVTSMIVYLAVIALLIIASSWLLGSAARSVFPRRTDSPILIDPCGSTIHNFMSGAWRYAMCIAAVGYVSGVSRAIARLGAADTLMLNVLLSIGMLLACIALLILWEGMRRTLTFRATYTAIFFLMALGLILLPFLGTGYYTLFAGLANLAFTIASMFMMITCLRLSHLRSLDPIGVFGPFATIVYAGVSAGRLVGSSMFGSALGFSQILLAVLLCVYVLSFTGVIMSMARKAPHGSQTSAADFDPLDELSYSARSVSEEGDGTPGCAEAAGGRIDVPTFSGTREAASQIKAGRRPFKCEPAYSKVPPPHQMLRSVVVVHDAIPACCQAMKQTYQLSNREADVLELIARGRDTAHVAEALFVSENIVKSHCKNLYRKLGIHSRQELFDLIDEFKGSDEHH